MARSRNIKPGFFANEHLASLSYEVRLLFIGLWTLADRDGRLEDRPVKIKMQVFPADTIDVDRCLQQLVDAGEPFIQRYEGDGVRVIQIVNWSKHQRPHHQEAESVLPASKFAPRSELTSHPCAKDSVKGIRNQGLGIKKEAIGDQESRTTPDTVFEYFVASNASVKPKSLSQGRRSKIIARLKVKDWPWREAIDRLPIPNTDSFTFQPDLDWLIKNDDNARKVADGKYDQRSAPAAPPNDLAAEARKQHAEITAKRRGEVA